MGCVYLLHCRTTGKNYVGQTVNYKDRMQGHKDDSKKKKTPLYNAIRKYGWNDFDKSILQNDLSESEMNFFEKWYIKMLSSTDRQFGYNLMEGGANGRHSEETKKKVSESRKGKCVGPENYNYGKHLPEEVRNKISNSRKGKMLGTLNHNYGKTLPNDTKKKISVSRKGKCAGKEHYNYKPVFQYSLDGVFIKEHINTYIEGFKRNAISNNLCGISKKSQGFIWSHLPPNEFNINKHFESTT